MKLYVCLCITVDCGEHPGRPKLKPASALPQFASVRDYMKDSTPLGVLRPQEHEDSVDDEAAAMDERDAGGCSANGSRLSLCKIDTHKF